MAYRSQLLGLKVRLQPREAAELIAAAWREHKTETATAKALGCGRRSLQRWVAALVSAGFNPKPVVEQPEATS